MFTELKNVIYAVLITSIFIFIFVKSVEASPHEIPISDVITLPDELLDKAMAVMVLGGIDYYVDKCTELTPRGIEYRDTIISYHEINAELLPINPGYIKGALSVSIYNCDEMYELVTTLEDSEIVLKPEKIS
jgi:hypothetical protein